VRPMIVTAYGDLALALLVGSAADRRHRVRRRRATRVGLACMRACTGTSG